MKIKYEFVTETVEIEVTAEWAEVLKECDRTEFNLNQKETRRHTHLDSDAEYGEWVASEELNPSCILEEKLEAERIQTILAMLTPTQRELIEAIFVYGMSINDYAEYCGVDHSAISHRLGTIRKKLRALLG